MMKIEKKEAFLAYREKILQELGYVNSRIEEDRMKKHSNRSKSPIHIDDSSDSDSEQPLKVQFESSLQTLRRQQRDLRTCLQATEELTSMQVLQSRIVVMTEPPVLASELTVSEEGLWHEVTAECRVNGLSFSISFNVHRPASQFGVWRYENLKTSCARQAVHAEVSRSILGSVTTPSDVYQILKNYSLAQRSRRLSLMDICKNFDKFMKVELLPEGGYLLKCANLLEISWTLQNKLSPMAHFSHRLKFDLEYINESYIEIVKKTYKRLLVPTIDTTERTSLIAKIISTCLEAGGHTQTLYESMSSDPEIAQSSRVRGTIVEEEQEPLVVTEKKVQELMESPKYLPKETKPEQTITKTKKAKTDSGNKDANKIDDVIARDKAVNREKSGLINKNNDATISKKGNTKENYKTIPNNDKARLITSNSKGNVVTMKKGKENAVPTNKPKTKEKELPNAERQVQKNYRNSYKTKTVNTATDAKNNAALEKQSSTVPSTNVNEKTKTIQSKNVINTQNIDNNREQDKPQSKGNSKENDVIVKTVVEPNNKVKTLSNADKNKTARDKPTENKEIPKTASSKVDANRVIPKTASSRVDTNKNIKTNIRSANGIEVSSNKPDRVKQNDIPKIKHTNKIAEPRRSVISKLPIPKINVERNKYKIKKQSVVETQKGNTEGVAKLKRPIDKTADVNINAKRPKLSKPEILKTNKLDK